MSLTATVARTVVRCGRILSPDFAWWLGTRLGWILGGWRGRDQDRARALALLERHRAVASGSVWALSWAWAAMVGLALAARAVSGGEEPDTAMNIDAASLHGLDEITREQVLLDAADRLHRTTPPVRRF